MKWKGIIIVCFIIWLLMRMVQFCEASEVDQTKAVIHHTASGDWTTIKDIRRWHVEERGWDDIGYHYIVFPNGSVKDGRPIWKKGAHAKGRNRRVGIALVGHDRFTDLQLNSLQRLLVSLGVQSIERHHGECPGDGLDEVKGFAFH